MDKDLVLLTALVSGQPSSLHHHVTVIFVVGRDLRSGACQFGGGGGLGPQRRKAGPLGGTRGESMSEACFLLEKWRKEAKIVSLISEH